MIHMICWNSPTLEKNWWMRLESNQQCREAEDLQSSGVTNFPTHPKFNEADSHLLRSVHLSTFMFHPTCKTDSSFYPSNPIIIQIVI